jgi:hypothetical protein
MAALLTMAVSLRPVRADRALPVTVYFSRAWNQNVGNAHVSVPGTRFVSTGNDWMKLNEVLTNLVPQALTPVVRQF